MKIPEKAPSRLSVIDNTEQLKLLLTAVREHGLNEFISTVEQRDEYVYWDKFKYFNMPDTLSPELAWTYLKMIRQSKLVRISLVSNDGKNFGYWTPDSILQDLSFIDRNTSGNILVGVDSIHNSEQKKYLSNSLMEEAIASSQLEGAATTRRVAKEMLRSGRRPKSHAEQMIFNNYRTIMQIKDLINQPLNDKLVLKLHKSMTSDTLEDPMECGRFRNTKDEPIYVKDETGQILYTPPPAEKIPFMMKRLYDYANKTDGTRFIHPVIKAVILHFYLSYIHPFMDGNGRTARAILYWYMLKKKYWMFEYFTISRIFVKTPARYARAFLYTEIDDLDITYFLSFHLRAIRNAIIKLINYIKQKQKEARVTAHYLRQYPELNDRQKMLLRNALENPERLYDIFKHQSIHNITYETARRDLLGLMENGFLIKTKKGRKFYFIASEKLNKKIKHK